MEIINKIDAKALGLKRYFTGIPCGRGHVAERTTSKNDCVDCLYDRQKKWNAKNSEKINAKSKDWYEKNLERAKETRKNWRLKNADKDRADRAKYQIENKERLKNAQKIWAMENRDKLNAKSAKRRVLQLRATPKWANLEAILLMYRMAIKLTFETGIEHHVDHIVPLRSKLVCGLHWEVNLQILTASQNQSKSNRYWPHMPD